MPTGPVMAAHIFVNIGPIFFTTGPSISMAPPICGKTRSIGPSKARKPPKPTTIFCAVELSPLNLPARFSTTPMMLSIAGASASPNAICAPSIADCIRLNAPCEVSFIVSAIAFDAPAAFWNSVDSSAVWPVFSLNTKSAVCADLPTSSNASSSVRPFSAIAAICSVTGPPSVPMSARMRRSAVPAALPLMPALASVPSIAVVSSMDSPAAFATGPTYFIESANESISSAEVLNDLAMTSVTLPVSLASMPKPRNVAPATSAACPRSDPVA